MDKKAVSVMIGYVLLIVGVIVIGGIVYAWLSSYVPRATPECPDGVSLFVESSSCVAVTGGYNLTFSIKNNGRFEVNGYLIKASEQEEQMATKDISGNIESGGSSRQGVVSFLVGALSPGKPSGDMTYILENQVYSIEITPIMYETIEGKNILISCGDAKVKETITCT